LLEYPIRIYFHSLHTNIIRDPLARLMRNEYDNEE